MTLGGEFQLARREASEFLVDCLSDDLPERRRDGVAELELLLAPRAEDREVVRERPSAA